MPNETIQDTGYFPQLWESIKAKYPVLNEKLENALATADKYLSEVPEQINRFAAITGGKAAESGILSRPEVSATIRILLPVLAFIGSWKATDMLLDRLRVSKYPTLYKAAQEDILRGRGILEKIVQRAEMLGLLAAAAGFCLALPYFMKRSPSARLRKKLKEKIEQLNLTDEDLLSGEVL